ncbi:TIGR03086 family metal-binding protein [Kitasatospora sp. NPDC050543]|uniref:TIGR03086 family metal-binding protein n=1 Tax=Kitasatospora sp. NPDC050543 TaxID=3364054 RepID=UPI00379900AA
MSVPEPESAPASADPVDLLARSLAQTGALIAGVRGDQGALPTPCPSWSVSELLGHLVHDLRQFTIRAGGGQPEWSDPVERIEGSARQAFEHGAAALLTAWRRAGDLTGVLEVPGMGELPARFPVDQQVAEFAVHAWDLARATGQSTELDEEVGRSSLEWARRALRPEHRGTEAEGHVFGPEVPVPSDAPLYDRLAAWFGRDPGRH